MIRDDPRESAELSRVAEFAAARAGDDAWRLAALRLWAEAELLRGETALALSVLELARDVPDGHDAAARRQRDDLEILHLQVLVQSDALEQARELAAELTSRFEASCDRVRALRVVLALADLAFRADRPREALRCYRRAVRSLPASPSPRLLGLIASNRANALTANNRFRAADRHFERAAAILEEAGSAHTVAQVAYNHAYTKGLRGDYRAALRDLQRLESTFERFDDRRHVAHVLLDRAEMELRLNLASAAAVHAGRAAEMFASLGCGKETAQAQHLSGVISALAGRHAAAAGHFRGAAAGFEALGLDARRAKSLLGALEALRQLGSVETMDALDRQVEALLVGTVDVVTQAEFLLSRARTSLEAGDAVRALEHLATAAASLHRVHAPSTWRELHRLRGRALRVLGDLDGAVEAYVQATDLVESARAGVPPDQYMTAFLAAQAALFRELVDLLYEAGRHDEAYAYSERARARALGDAIASAELVSDPGEKEGALEGRLDNLRRRLNATYRRLFDGGDLDGLRDVRMDHRFRSEAAVLESEILHLLRRRDVTDDDAAAVLARASGADEIRRGLDARTCLLAYYFTNDRLLLFVIESDRITALARPVTTLDVQRHLGMLHFHLSKFTRRGVTRSDLLQQTTRANLEALAALVLAPALPWIRRKRVVVVPDGPLHFVPFHALPVGDDWAVDRFELSYAPSGSVFIAPSRPARASEGSTAVFGLADERAPHIADEVRAVADRVATDRVYEQEAATSDRLRAELRSADVVHLATHGQFRAEAPLLSSIRLADGWFAPHDLQRGHAAARLVVLSACESGAADVSEGNEILGVARGFLAAGVGSVLCTQWRIDDAVTVLFMSAFHAALAEGAEPSAACRSAMDAVRRDHPHPYHWAPFFLVGRSVRPELDAPAAPRGGRRGARARDGHGEREAGVTPAGERAPRGAGSLRVGPDVRTVAAASPEDAPSRGERE